MLLRSGRPRPGQRDHRAVFGPYLSVSGNATSVRYQVITSSGNARLSPRRDRTPGLVKPFRSHHSTVSVLKNSCVAISQLDCHSFAIHDSRIAVRGLAACRPPQRIRRPYVLVDDRCLYVCDLGS